MNYFAGANIYRNIAIEFMGTTKTLQFSEKQARTAELAKALGHPARIAILQILMKSQTCYCGDIVDELPLAQATVSQHLKELKDAGIIKGEISGVKTCYCINEKVWDELKLVFNTLLAAYKPVQNCC